jgi:membrane protein YqaA with SNARE-associated domain
MSNASFYKTFPIVWGITIVGGTILWIALSQVYGLSFILGNVTSLYMMSLLNRSSKRLIELDEQSAKRVAARNYYLRYGFYAIILLSAALLDQLDLLTTGLSFFVFKIVFYIVLFVDMRKEDRKNG